MILPHPGFFGVNSGGHQPSNEPGFDHAGVVKWQYTDPFTAAYNKGFRNFFLHMLAGWQWTQDAGTYPCSAWYSMPVARRDELEAQLTPWFASRGDAHLLVYHGFGVVDDVGHATHKGIITPVTGLDPSNQFHFERMVDNARGLHRIAPGRTSIMLDAASKPDGWRMAALKWSNALRPHGIPVWGEAFPLDHAGRIIAPFVNRMPWFCIDRFTWRDIEQSWTNPGAQTLAVWVGWDQQRKITVDEVASLMARGFTPAVHTPQWRDTVAALYAAA